MLKVNPRRRFSRANGRFGIVASCYNARYVNGMLKAARDVLRTAGVTDTEIVRVPGSFEIPLAAAALAQDAQNRPSAIICLGVIWQGETLHAEHIGGAITDALMRIAIETGVPVIHEVLIVQTAAQAKARCLDPDTNRGAEAAQTALEMASLIHRLTNRSESLLTRAKSLLPRRDAGLGSR